VPGFSYALTGYLTSELSTDSIGGAPSYTTAYTQGSNAGSYNITASANDLTSALGYGFTYATLTNGLTVGKKTLTPTVQNQDITYGAVTPTLSATDASDVTWSGFITGDNATSSLTGTTFTYGGATTGSVNNAGSYTLGINAIASVNYSLGGVTTGTLLIGKKTLTPTVQDQGITYGTATPTLSATDTSDVTWSGFVTGDNASNALSSATFTYGGAAAGSINNAASYTLGVSSISSTNYSLGSVTSGTLTISPKGLTVIADDASKSYGASDPTLTYHIDTSGLVGMDADPISGVSVSRASGNNVDTYAITASGGSSSNGNYTIGSYTAGTFTIEPATLTVTPNDATRNASQANPVFAGTITGFIGGENSSVLTAQPVYATNATGDSPAGIYNITASGAAALNYNFDYLTGVLTVTSAPVAMLPSSVISELNNFGGLANGLGNTQYVPYYSSQQPNNSSPQELQDYNPQASGNANDQDESWDSSDNLPPLPQLPTDKPLQILVDPVLQESLNLPPQI
jgi:hypothetical protein